MSKLVYDPICGTCSHHSVNWFSRQTFVVVVVVLSPLLIDLIRSSLDLVVSRYEAGMDMYRSILQNPSQYHNAHAERLLVSIE